MKINIKESFKEMFQAIEDKKEIELVGNFNENELQKNKRNAENKRALEVYRKKLDKIIKKSIRSLEKKRCGRCDETKLLTLFSFDKNTINGYACYCKQCIITYTKERNNKKK